jgi:hypothetical protein
MSPLFLRKKPMARIPKIANAWPRNSKSRERNHPSQRPSLYTLGHSIGQSGEPMQFFLFHGSADPRKRQLSYSGDL